MSDDNDLDLYDPAPEAVPDEPLTSGPSPWPIIVGLAVVLIGAVAFYWLRPHRVEPPVPPAAASTPAQQAPSHSASAPVQTTLPPLEESDPAVREIVGAVSSHPLVTAWLGGQQLLRGAMQVLVAIAEGQALPSGMRTFAPHGPFTVRSAGGRTVIDPASYRRFDAVGDAASSVNPATAAAAYHTLRPRLDDAFRELGMNGTVDDIVRRGVATVLAVPIVEGDVPVVSKGAVYAYADPTLEALPPVSKLLLRMGPQTVRRVQETVRSFAGQLGM